MYELTQVGPRSYYIDCPAKIGVYTPDGQHVILIDSGNDKDAGRKVRQVLDRQQWSLTAILNTHSNADHIGGNRYLQSQTGCKIFANGIERAMTCHPILEPSFLYGGFPCKELRHKFLMAQESDAVELSDPDFPKEIEVLPLPGHFFDMVGYRTPDDVVFLADCVSSEATLDKYGIPFIYDVEAYLQTLDRISEMTASLFVPAHAEPAKDIRPLATYNRVKVLAVADHLLEICRTPVPFDVALQEMFSRYELTMNFEQYVLVGSTIRSYFSWLMDTGRVSASFTDNHLRLLATRA
ncbi:MAG TPA: MBL fold metallo-hydrolase [Candidatus Limiplasma sp.]|nr:MBL fold metallo-hydrolase [Candidatus Limiplasma sp.]HPS80679.1 MBL fold metallo-hydrolase [Candidatus Limiplasma sp.]